ARRFSGREERRAARERREGRGDEDGGPGRGRGGDRQPGFLRAQRPARDASGAAEAAQGRRRVSADAHFRQRGAGADQRARARSRRQGPESLGRDALTRLAQATETMGRRQAVFLFAFGALAVALGLVVALALGLGRSDDPPGIAGFVYPEPKAISPFTLSTQDGRPFDLESLKGKWSFVYFGHPYCPDVCPTTLAELARARKLLEEAGADAAPQHVFAPADPPRHTPPRPPSHV